MSTFDGHVKEFPDIRIDYFRPSPNNPNSNPPLAYFLSHIHSDHLTGLETCKSLFIYCSPATRDILLRLEKYPHRMNFAKGILESRRQTYGHLRKLLKAIPLEMPTVVELAPGRSLRVSLFEANHCVGAVGFLIEGDGKAVFYSGDVRAEGWWMESLLRSPFMLPFTCVGSRRLDCVYLDTTFATKGEGGMYKEFPSKAEGLRDLVEKVGNYPRDTVFYYDAWTFGYEDVWQVLATVLDSKVHLDDYRYGLYRALANGVEPKAPEAAQLVGFNFGNRFQDGCLTDRWSRLHSCEYGTGCAIWEKGQSSGSGYVYVSALADRSDFVRITPIISRHNGMEMRELGAGGGKGDLNPKHELEFGDAQAIAQMIEAYEPKLNGQPDMLSTIWTTISAAMEAGTQSIKLDVPPLGLDPNTASLTDDYDILEDLPLQRLLPALAKWLQKDKPEDCGAKEPTTTSAKVDLTEEPALPKQITFPYSRHSSYSELCLLISALKPRDIHPCTVDSANWDAAFHSMEALFAHLYTEEELQSVVFSHDRHMMDKGGKGEDLQPWRPYRGMKRRRSLSSSRPGKGGQNGGEGQGNESRESGTEYQTPASQPDRPPDRPLESKDDRVELTEGEASLAWRREVHASALGADGRKWEDVELVSVSGHQTREMEM